MYNTLGYIHMTTLCDVERCGAQCSILQTQMHYLASHILRFGIC